MEYKINNKYYKCKICNEVINELFIKSHKSIFHDKFM